MKTLSPPPYSIKILGEINEKHPGVVESYIYHKLENRLSELSNAIDYLNSSNHHDFDLNAFLCFFKNKPGLKRSIDKIYEIIAYSLFKTVIESMDMHVSVSIDQSKKTLPQNSKSCQIRS